VSAPVSRRTLIIGVLIVVFLGLQLAVPAIALFGPRPARFAWQMYSALPDVPRAWTIAADGTESPVDLEALFAVRRAEIDYTAVLRTGLCDATDAPAVKIQATTAAEPEVIACR
jgi:hypothetical protein